MAADTSVSIDDRLLVRFGAEVAKFLEDYDTTILVFNCDTRFQGVQTFERQDLPLKLSPKGGAAVRTSYRCLTGFRTYPGIH